MSQQPDTYEVHDRKGIRSAFLCRETAEEFMRNFPAKGQRIVTVEHCGGITITRGFLPAPPH